MRAAIAALLPGFALKDQYTLRPPKAELPGAQLITASEKGWREGTTIVAAYFARFHETIGDRHDCGDVGVVLLKRSNNGFEVVAKSDLVRAEPGIAEEYAENPDHGIYDCRAPVAIDTAAFRINEKEVAFGVRFRYDLLIKTDTRYRESLRLFRVTGTALHTILSIASENCDCATIGGRGCGKMASSTARCEPRDGTEYRKLYLKMLPTQTAGMFDIELLQETTPGEKATSMGVLRWSGNEYSPTAQPVRAQTPAPY